jgi:hypothetical protein
LIFSETLLRNAGPGLPRTLPVSVSKMVGWTVKAPGSADDEKVAAMPLLVSVKVVVVPTLSLSKLKMVAAWVAALHVRAIRINVFMFPPLS